MNHIRTWEKCELYCYHLYKFWSFSVLLIIDNFVFYPFFSCILFTIPFNISSIFLNLRFIIIPSIFLLFFFSIRYSTFSLLVLKFRSFQLSPFHPFILSPIFSSNVSLSPSIPNILQFLLYFIRFWYVSFSTFPYLHGSSSIISTIHFPPSLPFFYFIFSPFVISFPNFISYFPISFFSIFILPHSLFPLDIPCPLFSFNSSLSLLLLLLSPSIRRLYVILFILSHSPDPLVTHWNNHDTTPIERRAVTHKLNRIFPYGCAEQDTRYRFARRER